MNATCQLVLPCRPRRYKMVADLAFVADSVVVVLHKGRVTRSSMYRRSGIGQRTHLFLGSAILSTDVEFAGSVSSLGAVLELIHTPSQHPISPAQRCAYLGSVVPLLKDDAAASTPRRPPSGAPLLLFDLVDDLQRCQLRASPVCPVIQPVAVRVERRRLRQYRVGPKCISYRRCGIPACYTEANPNQNNRAQLRGVPSNLFGASSLPDDAKPTTVPLTLCPAPDGVLVLWVRPYSA